MITHRMGVTFTKLGLHPGMAATHFLPAVVGPQVTIKLKSDLQVFYKFNQVSTEQIIIRVNLNIYSQSSTQSKVFVPIAPSTSNSSTPSI